MLLIWKGVYEAIEFQGVYCSEERNLLGVCGQGLEEGSEVRNTCDI